MKQIKCIQCGKLFTPDTWNACLCSDKCRSDRNKQKNRERRQEEKERRAAEGVLDNRRINIIKRKPGKLMEQLTQDAIEARRRGMTYGKYMARRRAEAR